jgi:hypothetical protein
MCWHALAAYTLQLLKPVLYSNQALLSLLRKHTSVQQLSPSAVYVQAGVIGTLVLAAHTTIITTTTSTSTAAHESHTCHHLLLSCRHAPQLRIHVLYDLDNLHPDFAPPEQLVQALRCEYVGRGLRGGCRMLACGPRQACSCHHEHRGPYQLQLTCA